MNVETDVREARLQLEEEDENEDAYTRGGMLTTGGVGFLGLLGTENTHA